MPRRRLLAVPLAATLAALATCGPPEDGTGSGTAAPDTTPSPGGVASSGDLVTRHTWTAGPVADAAPGTGVATVTSMEVEGLPEMDRIVLTLDGDRPPGYHLEYVVGPIRECGSGRAIQPPGEAWLQLRLSAARGHTEAGEATLDRRRDTPELEVVRGVVRTCDFEGVVELILSVTSPNPYRLSLAEAPTRLILDVRRSP